MDIYLPERTRAGIDEFVRRVWWNNRNLPGAGFERFFSDGKGGLALLDDKDFLVGMFMQPWAICAGYLGHPLKNPGFSAE